MKLHREIKVQKLQNKNRMVGQTFNIGGHTSESLDGRERKEIERIKSLTQEEFTKLKNGYKEIDEYKEKNNLFYSNSFKQNVFIRNFSHRM